ncbi:MAG: serine/threonine protein phosphatase [Polyangiaceae bacterium]|nr:serine/threonine protein phosphatase [Polyangiaceae bacterium]
MAQRTFAIGDIHGDLVSLKKTLALLPPLDAQDTLVLMGDYVDRGPESAQVIEFIRTELPKRVPGKLVCLRGNHEDGWLRVLSFGWSEFVMPSANGCLATLRSFNHDPTRENDLLPTRAELTALQTGAFFPADVVEWMKSLPFFYEDEHAIYVHAGLLEKDGQWIHPADVQDPAQMLWVRTMRFFDGYRGKRVVCGHTSTDVLPPELSSFTPEDPLDMWVRENVVVVDTGCGKGGFLTALELPTMKVYESRN